MSDRTPLTTPSVRQGYECLDCGYDDLNCRCDDEDFMDDLECTICGGDGICDDGADPLWDCPPEAHFCHSCNGTGKRRDQRYM